MPKVSMAYCPVQFSHRRPTTSTNCCHGHGKREIGSRAGRYLQPDTFNAIAVPAKALYFAVQSKPRRVKKLTSFVSMIIWVR
jgi:hypothetical protein